MRRNFLIGTFAALFLLAFSSAANAQSNTKKTVVFPAGKSSVVYNGTISDLRTQQIYNIKLRKGQIIYILLTSKKRLTTFNLFNSAENESIGSPQGETQELDFVAEAADNYSVIVTINESDAVDDYVLTFKIKDKLE